MSANASQPFQKIKYARNSTIPVRLARPRRNKNSNFNACCSRWTIRNSKHLPPSCMLKNTLFIFLELFWRAVSLRMEMLILHPLMKLPSQSLSARYMNSYRCIVPIGQYFNRKLTNTSRYLILKSRTLIPNILVHRFFGITLDSKKKHHNGRTTKSSQKL